MKVLYFGTYESDWPRNRVIIDGLRENGAQVDECHVALWEKLQDKYRFFSAPLLFLTIVFPLLLAYLSLATRLVIKVARYDAVIVGNLGHIDLFLAALVCRPLRTPLVFVPNVSFTDSIVEDRGLVRQGSVVARLLFWTDKLSIFAADLVILDTEEYVAYFHSRFGAPKRKLARVFVGARAYASVPEPAVHRSAGSIFRVLFVGKFTPLHGLEHIVRAAGLLPADSGVSITIVGRGQESAQVHSLAGSLGLDRIAFIDWLPEADLHRQYLESDAVLGVFGTSRKASLVIPNKVSQGLALGVPVITGDTAGARELLTHRETAYLCQVGDPQAIADAIVELKSAPELRHRMAAAGLRLHAEMLTPAAIGRDTATRLEALVRRPSRASHLTERDPN